MNVLVTTGSTQAPVDRVRCITNIFSGRTGARVAAAAFDRGHAVTLLTSHPEVLDGIPAARPREAPGWRVRPYRTFADLEALMADEVRGGGYGAVVLAAAVGDYHVAGVFARRDDGSLADAAAGKVKSSHPEVWLKLTPAPKLVDKVRTEWGFGGVLVKFKLEVGATDAELLDVAERSRVHSGADLMVANTLDGMGDWAFVGGPGGYAKVPRADLPAHLLAAAEAAAVTRTAARSG